MNHVINLQLIISSSSGRDRMDEKEDICCLMIIIQHENLSHSTVNL